MIDDLKGRIRAIGHAMFNRSGAERDLNDEIQLHIELETNKNMQAGLSATDARRLALVAFGGIDKAKEAHRDGRGVRWLHDLRWDTRFALRTLRRSPAFAVTAILTLGLGLGATTAIFSVVNAVILRPLPFASPNKLVMLWEENPDRNWKFQTAAPANFFDWRDRMKSLESSAAMNPYINNLTITGDGQPRQLKRISVTGSFFSTLGVTPILGRSFREEETWSNGSNVAILSYAAWQNQFGGQASVIGRHVTLNSRSVEIIGVLPQSFRYPGVEPDIWTPTAFPTANRTGISFRRAHYLRGIGRLKPGSTIENANAELRVIMSQLEKEHPETNVHMGAGASPLHAFLVGDTRRPLYLLLTAVSLLFLIACANVGNLQLVQAAARQRELAVRLALGASRARTVQQAVTESVTLSIVGGAAGLVLGWGGMRALAALQPPQLLPAGSIVMHASEIAFALALAVLSGLLFGVAPALWTHRRDPADVLKSGGRSGSASRNSRRWSGAMVVVEVSLAVLLTVGAGLLVKSYWQLQHVNPGFNPNGVMTLGLSLPVTRYDSAAKVIHFYEELSRRARNTPTVTAVGLVTNLPATDYSWSSDFSVAGRPADAFGTEVVHREMGGDYGKVMQTRLLAGRFLNSSDTRNAPLVVLINEALAKQYFANEDPIGKRVTFDRAPDSTSAWRTIVGVVSNERQSGIALPSRPEFIDPFGQNPDETMTLVIRSIHDVNALAPALRKIVSELDPLLAISSLRSMDEVRSESVSRERFVTVILLAFSVVGVVLAVVGVYGVMSKTARGRTREMGIRIALGAPVKGVQWLLVRYGVKLAATGVAIGLVVAIIGATAIKALLFEVKPLDAPTFIGVSVLLLLASAVASWFPAWRASRVDATTTLRSE